jgi:hypothetical protein
MKRLALTSSLLCFLAACSPAPESVSQSNLSVAAAPQAEGEHPDLSGYWMISFGPMAPNRPATPLEQSLLDKLMPDSVLLGDSGLVEFDPGNYGGLRVLPDVAASVADYDPEVQRSVATTCLPPSIAYAMQGPFPMEIFQSGDLVVIKMEYYDQIRLIFLNEDSHPGDWPPSRAGHSIGRWEGDELVVNTKLLQPSTLFNNGLDHSDAFELTERFRLSDDGKQLAVTQEFSDPAVFDGTGARVFTLDRGEGHVYPYDCDPSYGAAIQSRELE